MRANRAFVNAGDVHTYYEMTGTGEPVVLLHGSMCTAETFDTQTVALAKHHRVYVPERRGHGRTPDVPGPLTYDIVTADTIAFLETLISAPLISSAGATAPQSRSLGRVAATRPRPQARLIGQNLTVDGLRPAFKAMLGHLSVDHLPPMLPELYGAVSPDGPGHFADVFHRLSSSWTLDSPLPLSRLGEYRTELGHRRRRRCPHLRPGWRTSGRTHQRTGRDPAGRDTQAPMEQPDLVNQLILAFLTAPVPVRAT